MRVRIRTATYEMEYDGPSSVWNDVLRPLFGGPSATPAGRTTDEPHAPPPEPPFPEHATPADADSVYARLAQVGGRRGEKDAVLVAVWEHDGARRDVGFDEVARSVHAHAPFRDVRVKPHLLKHVNRTRMLDVGARRETVRLNDKGLRYVESLQR